MGRISYLKEAIKEKINIFGIITVIGWAIVAMRPSIAVIGIVAETVYLLVAPNFVGYKRLVDSRYKRQEKEKLELEKKKLLTSLSTDQQLRYKRLERMRDKLLSSKEEIGEDRFSLFADELEKVDDLLYSFLSLSAVCQRYKRHLKKFSRKEIVKDIDTLNKKLERDDAVKRSPKAQRIIKKNIDILKRRLEKLDNIRANLSALDAQIETIEDILGLFHDQMLTIRTPGDISKDLNELVNNVQLTQEAIEETDSFMYEFKKLEESKENLKLK